MPEAVEWMNTLERQCTTWKQRAWTTMNRLRSEHVSAAREYKDHKTETKR